MAKLPSIRRRRSRTERAMRTVRLAATAVKAYVAGRIAWLAGKRAARVAAPAVAVGAAAVVARKATQSKSSGPVPVHVDDRTPAGVA